MMKVETSSEKMMLMGLLTIVLCFAGAIMAWAAIPQQGIPCGMCHDGRPPNLKEYYQGSQGCINCHSSSDSSTTYELEHGMHSITVPVVNYTGSTLDDNAPTLAGGNFFWVQTEDSKGHNIFESNPDDNLTVAPGIPVGGAQDSGCSNPTTSCHFQLDNVNSDVNTGTRQGCTKCHMMRDNTFKGHHHADDSNTVVGSEPLGYDPDAFFRFLQGHNAGAAWGVSGIEDDDWEYTVSATDHNEYLGNSSVPKTFQQITPFASLGRTMTAFCCGCHGVFHYEKDASDNWVRHPSDAVLLDSGYTIFNPLVPVGRPDLTGWTGPSSTVTLGDFVMCLSCHRAHGSPYPKMLRWDMTDTTGKACSTCHTSLIKE